MSGPVQVSRRGFIGLLSLALALLPVGVCALSEADPLADAYVQLGGRARLGPILGPAFRRPTDPSLYLATQRTVLELAPDGRVGPASVARCSSGSRTCPARHRPGRSCRSWSATCSPRPASCRSRSVPSPVRRCRRGSRRATC